MKRHTRLLRLVLHISIFSMLVIGLSAQHVYERGTFVSIPAGKHINHSYYSTWNSYFAVEDGVLVYDHHNEKWLDAITASNGLTQYPVLLVWQDALTQDVWMVTPDYIFTYDELSDYMSRQSLPVDPNFSGKYQIGVTPTHIVVTSVSSGELENHSATFLRSSSTFDQWGANSNLEVDWGKVDWINPVAEDLAELRESLPVQTVVNGQFDAEGRLHLDNYPMKSASSISSLVGDATTGETFLSTYGMGIFHQKYMNGDFYSIPYGLLSPDVMSLEIFDDQLVIGGRAGLTIIRDGNFSYDEAITDPTMEYSFISALDQSDSTLMVAGRGGVFRNNLEYGGWDKLISKNDMVSKKIYALASGSDRNLMIATDRNAYLFHESGLKLMTLFPSSLDWPVFDVNYFDGRFYIASYFGLYIFDEASMGFVARISSGGDIQSAEASAAPDPIYATTIDGDRLWASTYRGLVEFNLLTDEGQLYLSPHTPFKPRGLSFVGTRVWVGTDTGLFSFEPKTSSWRHYTQNDGLISNFVTDLVAKDDYIWIGTNLGLTRIKWQNLY